MKKFLTCVDDSTIISVSDMTISVPVGVINAASVSPYKCSIRKSIYSKKVNNKSIYIAHENEHLSCSKSILNC